VSNINVTVDSLDPLCRDSDRETSSKVMSLKLSVLNVPFLMCMTIVHFTVAAPAYKTIVDIAASS